MAVSILFAGEILSESATAELFQNVTPNFATVAPMFSISTPPKSPQNTGTCYIWRKKAPARQPAHRRPCVFSFKFQRCGISMRKSPCQGVWTQRHLHIIGLILRLILWLPCVAFVRYPLVHMKWYIRISIVFERPCACIISCTPKHEPRRSTYIHICIYKYIHINIWLCLALEVDRKRYAGM